MTDAKRAATGDRDPLQKFRPERSDSISSNAASTITVIIGGPPTAKGRPRATRRGFVYTPAKTRRFEAHGRLAAQLAMNGRPPIVVPVRAEIVIDLPAPASRSAKRRDAARRRSPDDAARLDNYCKAAPDCINGIVVADDSLVVELVATKRYGRPQLTITITPLPALTAQGRAS